MLNGLIYEAPPIPARPYMRISLITPMLRMENLNQTCI